MIATHELTNYILNPTIIRANCGNYYCSIWLGPTTLKIKLISMPYFTRLIIVDWAGFEPMTSVIS